MSKVFAYVEAPQQLKEAIDFASNRFESVDFVIRTTENSRERELFLNLVREHSVQKVRFIHIASSGCFKRIFQAVFQIPAFFSVLTSTVLIIGNYRAPIARILYFFCRLINRKIVLVDDGLYLINYVSELKEKPIVVYTSLPIRWEDGDLWQVIEAPVRKIVSQTSICSLSFIGSKLVEIGYIREADYLDILRRVTITLGGYSVQKYYAHRGESASKIKKINDMGYQVIKPNVPLEDYLESVGIDQGTFVSFYSTALYKLSRMSSVPDYFYVYYSFDDLDSQRRASIENCYQLLERAFVRELEI